MDRRRYVLANELEHRGQQQLDEWSACEGYTIHSQMALPRALDIKNSGLSDREYEYALMASFDFVVAERRNRGKILFAVEVDGTSHLQESAQANDRLKNTICEKLGMPLIRAGPNALDIKLEGFISALTWLATLQPLAEALADCYRRGAIPADEIVFPTDAITTKDGKVEFPLDPSQKTIENLWQHVRAGHILRFPSSFDVAFPRGYSAGGSVTLSLAFVRGGTLMGVGGCLFGSHLPIPEHDVSRCLSLLDLERQISAYSHGQRPPLPSAQLLDKLHRYRWPAGWSLHAGDGTHPIISFGSKHA